MEYPWEDNLLERKVESDLKDLQKTLVAFANSVRPGHIAVLLVGETNDGFLQGLKNPDNIQNRVRECCENIYPEIQWRSQIYEKDGRYGVRVEIEYSGETPHFGAPAWIRRGASTIKASDEVFQRLIEYRLSKVRELAKWRGKTVIVEPDLGLPRDDRAVSYIVHPRLTPKPHEAILLEVNSFWVTFRLNEKNDEMSEPLEKVALSWQTDRLKLLIKP